MLSSTSSSTFSFTTERGSRQGKKQIPGPRSHSYGMGEKQLDARTLTEIFRCLCSHVKSFTCVP